jgi:hypothetical protein
MGNEITPASNFFSCSERFCKFSLTLLAGSSFASAGVEVHLAGAAHRTVILEAFVASAGHRS